MSIEDEIEQYLSHCRASVPPHEPLPIAKLIQAVTELRTLRAKLGEAKKACPCNCHDVNMRKATDTAEHANCGECAKNLAEEESAMADGIANDLGKQLEEVIAKLGEAERERDECRDWKAQQMAVESQWDCQAIAKMLGAQLGESCRVVIAREVPKLIAERDTMKEADRLNPAKMADGAPIVLLRNCYAVARVNDEPRQYAALPCGVICLAHVFDDVFQATLRTGDGDEFDVDNNDLFLNQSDAEKEADKRSRPVAAHPEGGAR